MISHTSAGVLLQAHSLEEPQVIARWPDGNAINGAMLDAAQAVCQKQRLHLQPLSENDNKQEMLLGQPILVDEKLWGVLVLRIGRRDKLDLQATMRLLQWGNTWLQFVLFQQTTLSASPDGNTSDVLDFLRVLLQEPSLEESAITLVNKLATRLDCPRVTLGIYNKQRVDLQAVSFSANFDKRTQPMRDIEQTMLEAIEQRVDIHFDSMHPEANHADGASHLILRAHSNLLQSSGCVGVHTYLLRKNYQIIGAITLETRSAAPLLPDARQWLEHGLTLWSPIFALHQAATVGARQKIKGNVLHFLQRWFGHSHILGKLCSGVLACFVLLLLIPADYWVYSDAVVENTHKHVVVAPQDGYLKAINVRPGEAVKQRRVLAQLDDEDLQLERRKLASQVQQYRQEYDNALATADRSQAAIANAQVEQARVQLQLIEQQLTRTQLKAPIAGIVVSDDIRQSLGVPVKQGEVLFEIASADGYQVQLYVDERDITAIHEAQEGHLNLTSLPGEILKFRISDITPISEVRNGRNYFRVEAQLEGDSALIRPGMTGSGKILAGRHLLGWIWFHDVWHWVRLTLWL